MALCEQHTFLYLHSVTNYLVEHPCLEFNLDRDNLKLQSDPIKNYKLLLCDRW